jgi:hypothetical protein
MTCPASAGLARLPQVDIFSYSDLINSNSRRPECALFSSSLNISDHNLEVLSPSECRYENAALVF